MIIVKKLWELIHNKKIIKVNKKCVIVAIAKTTKNVPLSGIFH